MFEFFDERDLSTSTAFAVFTSLLIAQFSSWAGAREIKDQTKALISRLKPCLQKMDNDLYIEIQGKVNACVVKPFPVGEGTQAEPSLEDKFLGERGLSLAKMRLQKKSNDLWALRFKAHSLFIKGCFKEAAKTLTEVIELELKLERHIYAAGALLIRGLAKIHLGSCKDAITDFDDALHLEPDYADAWFHCGLTNEKLGRFGDAKADFARAIELGYKPPQ